MGPLFVDRCAWYLHHDDPQLRYFRKPGRLRAEQAFPCIDNPFAYSTEQPARPTVQDRRCELHRHRKSSSDLVCPILGIRDRDESNFRPHEVRGR